MGFCGGATGGVAGERRAMATCSASAARGCGVQLIDRDRDILIFDMSEEVFRDRL